MSPTSVAPAVRPFTATYRLQLHGGFTFEQAATVLPYLDALGISHVYLSPILTAVPGSTHCYDVLDHRSINPELGGRSGLERLADACHERSMGLIVDVVPNHMALVAPLWRNAPLWHVLAEGPGSAYAHWFDVDWDHLDGRFGLPVLGSPLDEVIGAGELTVDVGREDEGPAAGRPVVRYHEHVLPLRADGPDPERTGLAGLLGAQHWHLAWWRDAEVLNYRRFFEVDGLIGVRVEQPDVFADTHALLFELHHAGLVDGFRIDHPDGLADPIGYLAELADGCRPGTPIWIEKILEADERLSLTWSCAGTTGYDANSALSLALVDPGTVDELDRAWRATGGEPDFAVEVDAAKRQVIAQLLIPEVGRLMRRAKEALPHLDPGRLTEAMVELLIAVDVYRAYIRPDLPPAEQDPDLLAPLPRAVSTAITTRPDLAGELATLGGVLLDPGTAPGDRASAVDLCVRFQQTTGPVMAKSIEDTAFYRWHRLTALNEVGADPARGSEPGVTALHEWARNQADNWLDGLTALSTHDTKRAEDVRARLLAVSGDPDAWAACSRAAAEAADAHGVDRPTAHLLWQTLVGVGRASSERLREYLTKAVREAKVHSSWQEPDLDYEQRVHDLAGEFTGESEVAERIGAAIRTNGAAIRAVTLAQKLVQLTLPGVPDTYQGGGLVNLTLVDPDNRRPVDYAERQARLDRLDAGGKLEDLDDEALWLTSRTLRLRAKMVDVFDGDFQPIEAGPYVLGFVRDSRVATITTRAPGSLERAGGFRQQRFELPHGVWRDELSGALWLVDDAGLAVADVLAHSPVALLVKDPGNQPDLHRYAVWAPSAERVRVHLDADGGRVVELSRDADGWWSELAEVGDGRYAFQVDDDDPLPDPRSRWQPDGVHAPSALFDPTRYGWTDGDWAGVELHGATIYELHVGTFSAAGTFDGVIEHLDHLVDLGVSVIQLMPVAAFPGVAGWGYDGVAPFAVHDPYGGPEGLCRLVDAAHARGLGVYLDVVYNHLGPSGNYLARFGPYFTGHHQTPWGDGLNLDGPGSDQVRTYIADNVRQWLQDYHLDGLRLDAVHELGDDSAVHLLEELAALADRISENTGVPRTLIAESDRNDPRTVTRRGPGGSGGLGLHGQWADDVHHALHVAITGETHGYYADFADPHALPKVLAGTPFFHDGTFSTFRGRTHGRPVDEASTPAWRFIASLQTHDQVGNRAFGDRIGQLAGRGRAAAGAALLLTSPYTPMLFMGEEFDASTPWQYFTDHAEDWLADSIREGRRAEFASHGWAEEVPDPQDPATVEASRLDWGDLDDPGRRELFDWYARLLRLRRELPALTASALTEASVERAGELLLVRRAGVLVIANLGREAATTSIPSGARTLGSFGTVTPAHEGRIELEPDSTVLLHLSPPAPLA